MKRIASHPGANVFRTVVSILIISVATSVFLYKTDEMSNQVDLIASQRVVNEINTALSLVVYKLAIQGNLEELNVLDKSNPFDYLVLNQKLPDNYFGVVYVEQEIDKSGWFYASYKKQAVYNSRQGKKYWYQLDLIFNDMNNSGSFDVESEKLLGFIIKKASS